MWADLKTGNCGNGSRGWLLFVCFYNEKERQEKWGGEKNEKLFTLPNGASEYFPKQCFS